MYRGRRIRARDDDFEEREGGVESMARYLNSAKKLENSVSLKEGGEGEL